MPLNELRSVTHMDGMTCAEITQFVNSTEDLFKHIAQFYLFLRKISNKYICQLISNRIYSFKLLSAKDINQEIWHDI